VPFLYGTPVTGALRQGEILRNLWEHRTTHPASAAPTGTNFPVQSFERTLTLVLTADCDLEQDFHARELHLDDEDPTVIPHVLLCDLYTRDSIRTRFANKELFKPVQKNHNERYHRLDSAAVGIPAVGVLPDLYMDFRKGVGIPTANIYSGIRLGHIVRVATVPDVYIHDIMHRFYSYLARVALP